MGTSGQQLARGYLDEVVAPLMAARWPGLPYAAGRLGSGSDVLGLDDAMSRDHDWGLRLTVLVERAAVEAVAGYLERELPDAHRGRPTRFATTWDPVVRSRVEVATAADFAASRLGIGVDVTWSALDWLAVTGQSVLEVVAGPVFVDSQGAITDIRRRLAWYPEDVWRYVVPADWARIGQELPFVGRTGSRGDDLGSRVLTARIVGAAMHLGFLLERRWPPYPKWLGTMFAGLPSAAAAAAPLRASLTAPAWQHREAAICEAVGVLHEVQRGTGLPTGEQALQPFFDRPFRGLAEVPEVLLDSIADPEVRRLPAGVGSVEQEVDNVAVLTDPQRRVAAARAWRSVLGGDPAARSPGRIARRPWEPGHQHAGPEGTGQPGW